MVKFANQQSNQRNSTTSQDNTPLIKKSQSAMNHLSNIMSNKQISPALRQKLCSILSSSSVRSAEQMCPKPQNKIIQKDPKVNNFTSLESVKSLVSRVLKRNSMQATSQTIQTTKECDDSSYKSQELDGCLDNLITASSTSPDIPKQCEKQNYPQIDQNLIQKKVLTESNNNYQNDAREKIQKAYNQRDEQQDINMSDDEKNEKYYKKFDFFYRRTAFRSMTEFYKGLFKPILEKWRDGEKKSTKNFLQQFIQKQNQKLQLENSSDPLKFQKLMVSQQEPQETQSFKIEDVIQKALDKTFKPYKFCKVLTSAPNNDEDKKTLKYNTRKQDLFEQAYVFCNKLFKVSESENITDGSAKDPTNCRTTMTPYQMLEYTSAILSIVLSHHFQKKDIKTMIEGTSVDFLLVRDSMYKYSKKAEERLFANPCFAYFFIQFATCAEGHEYIQTKISKMDEEEDISKKPSQKVTKLGTVLAQNATQEAIERQNEMNERIVSEIELMAAEATQSLRKSFENDLNLLYLENKHQISNRSSKQDFVDLSRQNIISHILLQNIGINANQIAGDVLGALRTNHQCSKQEKPIIDSILEDIRTERTKTQESRAEVNQGFEKIVFKQQESSPTSIKQETEVIPVSKPLPNLQVPVKQQPNQSKQSISDFTLKLAQFLTPRKNQSFPGVENVLQNSSKNTTTEENSHTKSTPHEKLKQILATLTHMKKIQNFEKLTSTQNYVAPFYKQQFNVQHPEPSPKMHTDQQLVIETPEQKTNNEQIIMDNLALAATSSRSSNQDNSEQKYQKKIHVFSPTVVTPKDQDSPNRIKSPAHMSPCQMTANNRKDFLQQLLKIQQSISKNIHNSAQQHQQQIQQHDMPLVSKFQDEHEAQGLMDDNDKLRCQSNLFHDNVKMQDLQ